MLRILISAAIFATGAATAYAHGPAKHAASGISVAPAAAEAADVVDAFHAALKRGDLAAARGYLMDDALIFEGGAAERSAAEYATHHLPADAKFAAVTEQAIASRRGDRDGQTAWVLTEGQTTGIWREKPVNSVTTETMILRKSAAGWRIQHIHWSSKSVAVTKP